MFVHEMNFNNIFSKYLYCNAQSARNRKYIGLTFRLIKVCGLYVYFVYLNFLINIYHKLSDDEKC